MNKVEIYGPLSIIESSSTIDFKLGGSRRMKELHPNDIIISNDTDYDFYTQYTPDIKAKLTDLGFKSYDSPYKDNQCMGFFRNHEYDENSKFLYSVEITLKKDVDLYKTVFDNIDIDFYKDYIRKSEITSLNWKKCFVDSHYTYIEPTEAKLRVVKLFNMLYKQAYAVQKM